MSAMVKSLLASVRVKLTCVPALPTVVVSPSVRPMATWGGVRSMVIRCVATAPAPYAGTAVVLFSPTMVARMV